jgi:hypothetical protein
LLRFRLGAPLFEDRAYGCASLLEVIPPASKHEKCPVM